VTPAIVDVNVTVSGGGSAAGTGMVITSSGEVLTNNHVIADATSITVQIAGTGPTYKVHVVGYDLTDDIALLQIDGASNLTTVTIGTSSNIAVGERVVTLGNALGQSGTPAVTSGSITALDQTITASDQGGANAETLSGLIEINAQIQAGDSGGPLVDSSGKVIGIDTAAQVSNARFAQQSSTVAYAIPIDAAMTIVKQIESRTSSSTVHIGQTRALLGVSTQDTQSGAQVSTVESGSPAATAGIAAGDVIQSLDGTSIDSQATLRNAILRHQAGDMVRVSWIDAAGQTHTATVTLASGPPA
jgi:S1-C subfamily serine protease